MKKARPIAGLILAGACLGSAPTPPETDKPPPARWWKGNLHTHTLWSDGDDYPEMVVDWYKTAGYHFLAISDHNVLLEGEHWIDLEGPARLGPDVNYRSGGPVFDRYLARFGPAWVETREHGGKQQVRLKTLVEIRPHFEARDRFLLIPAEEITARWKAEADGAPASGGPVHLGAVNVRDLIKPLHGRDALWVMQENVNQVLAQRERTGQPMFPHLNHPNYQWGVTAEELMRVKGERFFEIYNGHSGVHNAGDASHLGAEKMWDVILAHRLADLRLEPMWGLATDDSHHYHTLRPGKQNPGRGWVVVRARSLTPESVVHAMEAGDFYASTGVALTDMRREGAELSLEIAGEPGVEYTVQFIGTRRDFDRRSEPLPAAPGTLPHRRYSDDVGQVFAEAKGLRATYRLRGDELYVRAKVVSTKPKPNASAADEFECAWTQPLIAPAQ
jgi:hypothetical protein